MTGTAVTYHKRKFRKSRFRNSLCYTPEDAHGRHNGFEDVVYGKVEIENSELEDRVLIKSDGIPTYNFANVIDDHYENYSCCKRKRISFIYLNTICYMRPLDGIFQLIFTCLLL